MKEPHVSHTVYEAYVKAQVEANSRKYDVIWVTDDELTQITEVIRARVSPTLIVCHGARNGHEVKVLGFRLKCQAIGTDLGRETAHVIQHDFHKTLQAPWDNPNVIYSNSLDHAYNPHEAVRRWRLDVSPDGIVIVHWSPGHNVTADRVDCYQAPLDEYLRLSEGPVECECISTRSTLIIWKSLQQ